MQVFFRSKHRHEFPTITPNWDRNTSENGRVVNNGRPSAVDVTRSSIAMHHGRRMLSNTLSPPTLFISDDDSTIWCRLFNVLWTADWWPVSTVHYCNAVKYVFHILVPIVLYGQKLAPKWTALPPAEARSVWDSWRTWHVPLMQTLSGARLHGVPSMTSSENFRYILSPSVPFATQ